LKPELKTQKLSVFYKKLKALRQLYIETFVYWNNWHLYNGQLWINQNV